MASLHSQGGWSFRELGRAFGCDYKTAQRHSALLDTFFSGIAVPETSSQANPRDVAKNRMAVELHNFENFSE
jgi:hypothetical protein